jgi:uncharacterized protein YecT (DUF1311 family)
MVTIVFSSSFAFANSLKLTEREAKIESELKLCLQNAQGRDPDVELCLANRGDVAEKLLADVIESATQTYATQDATYSAQFTKRLKATAETWKNFVNTECDLLAVDGYGGTGEEQDRYRCLGDLSLQRANNLAHYFRVSQ